MVFFCARSFAPQRPAPHTLPSPPTHNLHTTKNSAFLRAPRLLIADEATSALDTATEVGIISSLKELAAGRTSIFVAHRLSTVRGCDRIVVLAAGRVAESGSHAELMSAGGLYKRMWEMQAEEEARAEDGAGAGAAREGDDDDDEEGGGIDAATALTPMPVLSPRVLGG